MSTQDKTKYKTTTPTKVNKIKQQQQQNLIIEALYIKFLFLTGFLRKVYGILTSQLLLTTIVAAVCMLHEGIKDYVQKK